MLTFPRIVACLSLLAMAQCPADRQASAADAVDYLRDVKPLLTKHCLACHSPVRQKSGYRIDTAEGVIRGGDRGPAVVAGNSGKSSLIDALTGANDHPRMPPPEEGAALPEEEIALVRRWIDQGAKAPQETPVADPHQHWAFQPVRRPALPAVKNPYWVRNPIDAFIAAEHDKHGIAPAPEAPPHVLLRRLYLDLTGLPPTREEVENFTRNFSSSHHPIISSSKQDEGMMRSWDDESLYAALVDRLLTSPAYGERWGRHWMDVWRYSDWAGWGQQVRDSQPHIWHWRDWIIEQLNADRPYDEMVTAMLAADELTPTDLSELRATGYLVRNFKLLSREQWLQDTVEHTAKSLLGLTFNCARCHDHMSDPIEQQEYYAFRAIFEPHQVRIDRLPGIADTKLDGLPRAFDKDLTSATYFYIRGDERNPRKDRPVEPGVPELLKVKFQVQGVSLPRDAYDPLRQAFATEDDLEFAKRAVVEATKKRDDLHRQPVEKATPHDRALSECDVVWAEAKLAALQAVTAVERLETGGDTTSPAWRKAAEATVQAQRRAAVAEAQRELLVTANDLSTQEAELAKLQQAAGGNAADAKVKAQVAKRDTAARNRTNAEQKVKLAQETVGKSLDANYAKRKLDIYPTTSTGRRAALARWIADPQNPLTARVAVNHIWGRHFERAIVPSTANFGTLGAPPSHPQLLDWLAAELVDHDWRMKHIHRLIVMSNVYRQHSIADFGLQIADLRDSSNPQSAIHNPQSIDPDNRLLWHFPSRRLEAEVVRDCVLATAGQLDSAMSGADIDHQQGLAVKRRSLYFRNAAEKQMTFLKLFDMAGVNECYERRESVMPQQALALANSELTLVQSRLLARRLHEECKDEATFVTATFEAIISRPPREPERAECLKFLAEQRAYFDHSASRLTNVAAKADDGSRPSGSAILRARENLVHALYNHHEFVTLP